MEVYLMIQKKIIDKIEQFDKIIIHHHVSPDPDCIGSQLGLKYLIEESYPNKTVLATGSLTERNEFIGAMDPVSDADYDNALVIIVDVGDKRRIDDDRFLNGKELIKIDHHPLTEEFADLEWVDTSFAACAEMIIDLYIENKDRLTMTEKAARALYSGLLTDTGRFYYNSVTERTLRYAAEIYKYNFDKQALYADLYHKSVDELKYTGYIMANFEYTENGLGYMKIDQATQDKFEIDADFASGMVNTLANIKEVIMWMFFTEDKKLGKIRTSFRSRGPIVNKLAAKYGGGGHVWASGTLAENWDMVENIIKDADQLCADFNK
jgi:bifunctional oligoribonuclease and PAP phosphatase NrnA